jgi:hypothetical protein
MTEQKTPRNGRDFAIGFFGSILLTGIGTTLVGLLPVFLPNIMVLETFQVLLSLAGIGLVVVIPVMAFVNNRKFIGIGILSALVAVPLLLIGSCYTILLIAH